MNRISKILSGSALALALVSGGSLAANATTYNGSPDGYTTADGSWSCNMQATGTYAPCVQNTPTTGDETWQRGYKLTFNWTTPLDWQGNPYQRCVLSYYNPQTAYNAASLAPVQLDVPASWGTYTMPLDNYGWLQDGIVAGATSLKQEYYCYTPNVGASIRYNNDNAIIPDMPPTQPTTVVAAPQTDGSVDVTSGGSQALGVSPLGGYDMTVTNADGTPVQQDNVGVASAPVQAAGVHAMSAPVRNVARHSFRNLPDGKYVVRVAAYNGIGSSLAVSTKTITVKHITKAGKVQHVAVKASAKSKTVAVSWSAPVAATSAPVTKYQVVLYKGSHKVQTITTTHRSVTFTRVTAGKYTVKVAAVAKAGAGSTVDQNVTVKSSR